MQQAPRQFSDVRPVAAPAVSRLERFGLWLRDHQSLIGRLQWAMVAVYLPLLIVPALVPAPAPGATILTDLTRFAQFLFWGLWLPGVLVSVVLFGRLWCGLLCPEGALTAAASRHGKGWAIPRWMKWPGWPFALFAGVTVYGQMVSIYDEPRAALLILGGSSACALLVGWLYGKEKRVWCRFLCPVNGMFGLLSKLAPMHYRVDGRAWDACPPARTRTMRFNCEPMVPVRTMDSASPCHMCGRCAGFRDAVRLEARAAGAEIVRGRGSAGDSLMALVGVLGIGSAAFWWQAVPWGPDPARGPVAPWFLFGHGPDAPAVTLLAGGAGLLTLALIALALAAAVALPLWASARLAGGGVALFHRLALAVLPLAAAGIVAGLTRRTVAQLADSGLAVSAGPVWAALLLGGGLWALWLAHGILGQRRAALAAFAVALAPPLAGWGALLWA